MLDDCGRMSGEGQETYSEGRSRNETSSIVKSDVEQRKCSARGAQSSVRCYP